MPSLIYQKYFNQAAAKHFLKFLGNTPPSSSFLSKARDLNALAL